MANTIRVLELFSGIGGMHFACQSAFDFYSKEFHVVRAIDINPNANTVYSHNFPEVPLLQKSIEHISENTWKSFHPIDLLVMSPPCQPFTRQGHALESADPRCTALISILKLFKEKIIDAEKILLENVKGFEESAICEELVNILISNGYNVIQCLLNPLQIGIPNARLRYYLLASKHHLQNCKFSHFFNSIYHDFSSDTNKVNLCTFLEEKFDEFYVLNDESVKNYGKVFDIVTPNSSHCMCFTKSYARYFDGTGSLILLDSNLDVTQCKALISDAYAKNDASLVSSFKLRLFTPEEIARILCFPKNFTFPSSLKMVQKYKLLGNSINVLLVSQLLVVLLNSVEIALLYMGDIIPEHQRHLSFAELASLGVNNRKFAPKASATKKTESGDTKKKKRCPIEEPILRKAPRTLRGIIAKEVTRDPRFDDLSGNYSEEFFEKNYGFIEDIQSDEVNRLQKAYNSCKQESKREELKRLIQQSKDKIRRRKENSLMRQMMRRKKEEEKEKILQGKKPYFMKKTQIKQAFKEEKRKLMKSQNTLKTY